MIGVRLNLVTYTVTRTQTADPVNGRFVPGATSTLSIQANVQPANGRDLKVVDAARQTEDVRVVYTTTELYTVRNGYEPDSLAIAGEAFDVFRVEPWPSYFKAYVAKQGRP